MGMTDVFIGLVILVKMVIDRQTIVAFDLGLETFIEMPLPDAILEYYGPYSLGVLGGNLCFVTWVSDGVCEVWVMEEYGVAESWVKCHVFSRFSDNACLFGFTSRNELLIEDDDCHLVLYHPVADKAKNLEKYCPGRFGANRIVEYVDSLVWVAPNAR
ncbi:unnamed protein product [Lactuca virosa]|uniref:F-box associated domain-containing protein n=1 Tax=Lactuca virosa TaxID=75947 RepID=A0AAU9M8Y8_9ASTR|nr:unnamed protein product [Lactuca virosa]